MIGDKKAWDYVTLTGKTMSYHNKIRGDILQKNNQLETTE